MEELLIFVKRKMESLSFIGLNTSEGQDGKVNYTVDYWEIEQSSSDDGGEIPIKAGKQKTFMF